MEQGNRMNNHGGGKPPKMPRFNMSWLYVIILISLIVVFLNGGGDALGGSASKKATYTEFKEYIEKGYVLSVTANKNDGNLKVYVAPNHIRDVYHTSAKNVGPAPYVEVQYGSIDEVDKYLDNMVKAKKIKSYNYVNEKGNDFISLLINFAPLIIFFLLIWWVSGRMGGGMGGNDERENTLNALLTEMDGFGTNSGVIILAATNRVDMLDSALLRAGRFDREIHVDLPGLNERKAIFQVHLKPIKIDDTVDIDLLARQTPGFSGADIANVCNEAALIAARHDKKAVCKQDFLDAVDRIVGGLEKKTKVMTADEKRSIALHEAGHATISWFCQYANPLIKVTIVPRGQALGAAWYLPEERQITTKEQMLDEMCSLMGGRAAEELFTGHISSGAMNDLERATKSAYGMVAYLGMSKTLPNICYYNQSEYSFQRPYSETTAREIDEEVLKMVNEQYTRAKNILMEHKEGHNALAELLIQKEVIMAEDVEKIFGKRPWMSRSQEIMEDEQPKIDDTVKELPEVQAAIKEHEQNNKNAEEKQDDSRAEDKQDDNN